ncbi:MAG TPA: PilZ domain-containing protein [Sphingomicrobium sp.]|jgi:hypothetical protein|nr:PilZ domain-containing protein [Sphingomicrobium sp.]
MEHKPIPQNRRSRRSNVLLAATIEAWGQKIPVKLRNLSTDGALIEGEQLPAEGAEVLFRRNDLEVASRIAWVAGCNAGVAFAEKLAPEEVLRHIPSPKPRILPEFKRPGLTCRPLTADERRLIENWVWSKSPQRPGE